MAGIEPLMSLDELKTNRLAAAHGKSIHTLLYDAYVDTLIALIMEPAGDTAVFFVDNNVGLVFEIESLEIVGLQIEAFERSFLPKHAPLRQVWRLRENTHDIEDFGDIAQVFQTVKPRLVREVVKATQPQLGPRGKDLAAAVA